MRSCMKERRIDVSIERITEIPFCRPLHQSIVAIDRECFNPPYDLDSLTELIAERNVICKVAIHDGRCVGYVIWTVGRKSWHLDRLAVRHGFRRRRVGSQLMAEFLGARRRPRRSDAWCCERLVGGCCFLRHHGWLCDVELSVPEAWPRPALLYFDRRTC